MNFSFTIKNISNYRSQIMCFAMIWVVLYHYQLKGAHAFSRVNGITGKQSIMTSCV